MANDNDVQLEGYRDLSKWNDKDIQTVITFDKIFLPASMGACLLSLAKQPQTYPFVYGGQRFVLIVLANSIPPV